VLERIWLPERLCPGLSEEEVEGSLYKTLTVRFGLNLAAAHQWLRPAVATPEMAELLDVEAGAPVMMVRGATFTSDATPVEVEESYFRGDHVEFVIELGSYSNYARLRPVDTDGFDDGLGY
jgi:GntR family transcriptional regulator